MNRLPMALRGVKRLAWKEWREIQMVPVWTAIILGMAMVALKLFGVLTICNDSLSVLVAAWCGAAVFCASGLISREVGHETLQFLMAQPIGRRTVWWIKCAVGLAGLFASIIASTLAWSAVQRIIFGSEAYQFAQTNSVFTDFRTPTSTGLIAVQAFGAAAPWLIGALGCFAVTIAVSTLVDRSISAAMLAVAACVGLLMGIAMIYDSYSLIGGSGDGAVDLSLMIALLAPAFLAASCLAFCRGESLRTPRRFLWAGAGLAVGLAVTVTPAVFGLAWTARFQRSGSTILQRSLSPDGRLLALSVGSGPPDRTVVLGSPPTFRAQHLVIESVDGSRPPLVLHGGNIMAWSPDGRYLLYAQTTGILGLRYRYGGHAPVILDTRTGGRRRLSSDRVPTAWYGQPQTASWSPDGRWLAVQVWAGGSQQVLLYDCRLRIDNVLPASFVTADLSAVQGPPSLQIVGPADHSLGGDVVDPVDPYDRSLGWSVDSKCLFLAESRARGGARLVAIDIARVQAHIKEISRTRNYLVPIDSTLDLDDTGSMSAGCAALCVSPGHQEVQLSLSDDPHRALLTVHPDPAISGRTTSMTGVPAASVTPAYVVDLDAAARAAEARWEEHRRHAALLWQKAGHPATDRPPSDLLPPLVPPDVTTWARQSEAHLLPQPPGSARPAVIGSDAHISPDGLCVVFGTSGLTAVDLNRPSKTVSLPKPGPGQSVSWLPHSHILLQWKHNVQLWITDVSRNYTHPVQLAGQTVVGLSADNRLLLMNALSGDGGRPPQRGVQDIYHPISRSIPITVGTGGM